MTDDELAIQLAIDALDDTLGATIALCETFDDRDWARPTACPGWDVHDQVAHLAGLESLFVGRPRPDVEVPPLPHVVTDLDRTIESDVQLRRGRPHAEVLEELREVAALHIDRLRDRPPAPTDRIPYIDGRPLKARTALSLRVVDAWVHGEDIRRATRREPDLGAPAAELATDQLLRGFASVVEAATPPDGAVVQLEITGPFERTEVVAFDAEPTGAPTVTLRMDAGTFVALSAGRVPVAEADVEIRGDQALGRAVSGAMTLTP